MIFERPTMALIISISMTTVGRSVEEIDCMESVSVRFES